MIQKKICMVGCAGTGKSSLVRRYVESTFSERSRATVGVRIDRRHVAVGNQDITLLLWNLAGRSETEELRPSYLRGAAGVFYVVDGTRPDTLGLLFTLRAEVVEAIGPVPSIVALNKCDLTDDWALGPDDHLRLERAELSTFQTSAKTGERVDDAFQWLAGVATRDTA